MGTNNQEEEMGGIPMDMLKAMSMAEQSDIRKRQGHTRLVNQVLQELPPDLMIERIKGALYRNISIVETWQKCEEANLGQDTIADAAFKLITCLAETIKWIAINNGLDPYEPYGDDSYVVRIQDIVLGIDLEEEESLVIPPKMEYDNKAKVKKTKVEHEEDDEL